MGENVESARKGERIEIRKDRDGTISVWRMDYPLVQRATCADALAAIRNHFGQVNPKFVEFLTQR